MLAEEMHFEVKRFFSVLTLKMKSKYGKIYNQ